MDVEVGDEAALTLLTGRGSGSIIFRTFSLRIMSSSVAPLGGSALGNQAKGLLFRGMVSRAKMVSWRRRCFQRQDADWGPPTLLQKIGIIWSVKSPYCSSASIEIIRSSRQLCIASTLDESNDYW